MKYEKIILRPDRKTGRIMGTLEGNRALTLESGGSHLLAENQEF